MADGYSVNTAVLRRLAEAIGSQADLLRPRYVDGHRVDAGFSTGELGEALRHLDRAGADLSRLCEHLAGRLRDSAEVYDHAEATASAELERVARGGPLP